MSMVCNPSSHLLLLSLPSSVFSYFTLFTFPLLLIAAYFLSVQEIPPYNGFGSLEDSLQNCLTLIPEPPKKDLLKMLENDQKVLRYVARLVREGMNDGWMTNIK